MHARPLRCTDAVHTHARACAADRDAAVRCEQGDGGGEGAAGGRGAQQPLFRAGGRRQRQRHRDTDAEYRHGHRDTGTESTDTKNGHTDTHTHTATATATATATLTSCRLAQNIERNIHS
eukprot:995846-Rhodomonas_salina.1